MHVFVEEKDPFTVIADGLPQFAQGPGSERLEGNV